MGDSPASSDLSDPPSGESDGEERLSTSAGRASRRSIDHGHNESDNLAPPSKRRKTNLSSLANFDRAPSSHADEDDDNISVSSDGFSSAPGSPNDDEYNLREQAQTTCMWRDCDFGAGTNNDDLVKHVQSTHCATGGPKKTKYVCEWGECQRKTSNHPSGYALKAHMRSHTKEKPYYCALPECDKAFTRSDALAKHMRTVHEPEPSRGPNSGAITDTPPTTKKGPKLKLTNGGGGGAASPKPPTQPHETGPTHDEDGNEVEPSPPNDNITYIPAHHPITGQPGFMIHYPPDITFTAWESSIPADQLMRLLRRQVHWAEQEGDELRRELQQLEQQRRDEWTRKEVLLDGVLEAELAVAEKAGALRPSAAGGGGGGGGAHVHDALRADVLPAKRYAWSGAATPPFRRAAWNAAAAAAAAERKPSSAAAAAAGAAAADAAAVAAREEPAGKKPGRNRKARLDDDDEEDEEVEDEDEGEGDDYDNDVSMLDASDTPRHRRRPSLSPPPTGMSGGFDGDDDPYDNYLKGQLAEYEKRERIRSMQNTPAKGAVAANPDQQAAEADAVGALLGMSGGKA